MTDIVERLRKSAGREYYDGHGELELDAADEIEYLRSRLAVLESSLLKLRELTDDE